MPQFHLVIALLGYNVTYLIRAGFDAVLCKLAAIFLHFFLLASFFWSSCIAVRVIWGFYQLERGAVAPVSNAARSYRNWRVGGVAAVCWGVPLCGILVCVLLDEVLTPGVIGYGASGTNCWIGQEFSGMIVFAAPTFVSAFLNVIVFAATLAYLAFLRKSMSNIRSNAQFAQHSQFALIALRLFVSLGVQWIFGFVLFLWKNSIIEAIFTLLTSLQGSFVFVSIVTTNFVRQRVKIWAEIVLRGTRVTPGLVPSNHSNNSAAAPACQHDGRVQNEASRSSGEGESDRTTKSTDSTMGKPPWIISKPNLATM